MNRKEVVTTLRRIRDQATIFPAERKAVEAAVRMLVADTTVQADLLDTSAELRALVALHDDGVFACGVDDEMRVAAALANARGALRRIGGA